MMSLTLSNGGQETAAAHMQHLHGQPESEANSSTSYCGRCKFCCQDPLCGGPSGLGPYHALLHDLLAEGRCVDQIDIHNGSWCDLCKT